MRLLRIPSSFTGEVAAGSDGEISLTATGALGTSYSLCGTFMGGEAGSVGGVSSPTEFSDEELTPIIVWFYAKLIARELPHRATEAAETE